jgi:hypothetical protein
MDNFVIELLSLLVSVVIVGLFGLIGRLWTRVSQVEKRLAQAETAIFETQHVCNILGFGYEATRLLGLEIVRQFRDFLRRHNEQEPVALSLLESKPPLDELLSSAQEQAREATSRRNGYGR